MTKIPSPRLPVKVSDFDEYKVDVTMINAKRAAHALDWLARRHPYMIVPWNVLYRVIVISARTPLPGASEVKKLQRAAQRIRKHLIATFNRYLVVLRGIGVRATVDDLDKAKRVHVPATDKMVRTVQAVEDINTHIDVTKIPDTPENSPYRKVIKETKRMISDINERYPIVKQIEGVKQTELKKEGSKPDDPKKSS
jgi:hypothetical protein